MDTKTVTFIALIAGFVGMIVLIARLNYKLWLWRVAKLSEDQEYTLVRLWEGRFVIPTGIGQTITHINVEIENRTEKRLKVLITTGTYFESTGSHQNMVTRRKHRVTLFPNGTERVELLARLRLRPTRHERRLREAPVDRRKAMLPLVAA